MTVLGIDCSSAIMSVSLKQDERLFEVSIQDGFRNSEYLMPLVDHLFRISAIKPSDLDLIGVASGPGSFTGLRIAMSTAKGISFGTGCQIVSVPTLDAYAMGNDLFRGAVVPVIDARKNRFFASIFLDGVKIEKDLDIPGKDLLLLLEKYDSVLITGPDCALFSSLEKNTEKILIDNNFATNPATHIIKKAMELFEKKGADSKETGPVYLRRSEAEISMFGE